MTRSVWAPRKVQATAPVLMLVLVWAQAQARARALVLVRARALVLVLVLVLVLAPSSLLRVQGKPLLRRPAHCVHRPPWRFKWLAASAMSAWASAWTRALPQT